MYLDRPLPAQRQAERSLTGTGAFSGTSTRRRADGNRVKTCDGGRGAAHLINAELFRSALVRERRTADRSNQPFGVLLVTIGDRSAVAATVWDAAIEAVGSGKRETDVFGWFEQGASLGIILPDVRHLDAADVEGRVADELRKRLDEEAAARFSVRLHVHHVAASGADVADAFAPVAQLIEEARPAREASSYAHVKRVFDVVVSLLMLAVLSPLFLAIASLIKLTSRGPVFFRQKRIGQDAQPFMMLKFRSMQTGNSAAVHQDYVTWFIKSSDAAKQAAENKGSAVFKITNDPRVTKIGGFLRRTSIDELPQLWNVVRGEMSLVGPRPPLPYEVEQYKAWHVRRVLEAKPGITGLWQVAGRSRTTFDEMVRLDLRYARTCSFWTDIKILLATPRAVISGKGAC